MKTQDRGSLTIEASLVIPLFLFASFMVLSLIDLLRFHLNLTEAIHQESKRLAMEAYTDGIDEGAIRAAVINRLPEGLLRKAPVKEGAGGIDFGDSHYDNGEILRISAVYEGCLPYDTSGLFKHRFCAKCVIHTMTGYDRGLKETGVIREDEEYVYVTETGTVYHRDRECSYLRLSIRQVSYESLKDLRNSSGHKYYPCKDCGPVSGGTVYITRDGTSYHKSLDCSGLKRTVNCIPLSRVGARGPCSRCGHKRK